jgi:predicted esterase
MKRLRILCLHGYHGSAQILRRQLTPLADGLTELAEFVCIDAPSLAEGDFGWWHAANAESPTNAGVGPGTKRYEGWQRTRDAIGSAFAQQGPFDGAFGFSQGAALTALLVGLGSGNNSDEPAGTARKNPDLSLAFDFAIMVGGFASADPDLARLYGTGSNYELPSVHIIGRSDTIVPPVASIELASCFRNPLILEHEGGHIIPNVPQIRQRFRSFLEDRQQRKLPGL